MKQNDDQLETDIQCLLKRLPDGFRYARTGRHVSILTISGRDAGKKGSVLMRIGSGRAGHTMTLSCRRFGGVDRTRAVANALAEACGLRHDGRYKGPVPGDPNSRNSSGAGNINFRWQNSAGGWVLQVLAYVDTSNSGKGTRSWSTRLHGLEGALDKAISLREEAGYVVDRDLILKRLNEVFEKPPGKRADLRV